MLSSTFEYLKALREENYLLFLEWIDFIMQKYTKNSETLSTDDLLNFLIFEWINNDYSEEDAKKLSLLYAVYELETKPLKGKLDYALNTISVALFLCMIIEKENLNTQFFADNSVTAQEINLLVKQNVARVDPFLYKESLDMMQNLFFYWVKIADKKKVDAIFNKISLITQPRYFVEEYILYLEQKKDSQDDLHAARLSMAKRFFAYLNEQMEWTQAVKEEVIAYVNAIRELHPNKEENVLLTRIAPPSTLTNTWRWVTGIGMGFFSFVLREKSISELISGSSITPEV